jgi:SHS family lactate transporter-like MFS transporter
MASSAAAQIEADAGETLRTVVNGKDLPDYATIFGILLGVIIFWIVLWTTLGPDADGSLFEEAKVATQSGAGNTVAGERRLRRHSSHHQGVGAKPTGEHLEKRADVV